jgi:MFS family permease
MGVAERRGMEAADRRGMGLAIVTLAACALPLFLTASFAVAIRADLGLATSDIGIAVAAFWVVATLGALPSGRLVDRIGPARGLRLAGACVGVGSLGIAAFAYSFWPFALLLALTGLGNALVKPAMSVLIKRELSAGVQGTTFGLQQSGPPLGSIVAGLALPTAGALLGWRGVFAVGAALAVAATAAVRGGDVLAQPGPDDADPVPTRPRRRRATALLLLGGTVASGVANGLIAYVVVFSVESGLSPSEAGWLLTAAGITCVVTRIALGVLADRRPRPHLPQMAGLLLISVAGFALLAVDAAWSTVAGCVLALGIGWGWAGLYVLTAVERSGQSPGRAVGAAATGTFAGAIFGPLIVGLLADAASFAAAWLACASLSLVAAAAFTGARRLRWAA